MHKIKNYIIKNHNKFYFCLFINLIIFAFFNILFYCRFHTVDDPFMEMIACGAYGQFDSHLIYTNVIIGFFLKTLYSITNVIPWYGIMHLSMSFLSFSVILYVFFNKDNTTAKYICLITIFIISYEAYTRVQFTKTSAYLTTAGYLLIAHSLRLEKNVAEQIIGVLLLLNGFMVRAGMFFASSAVCLGLFVPVIFNFFTDRKTSLHRYAFQRLFLIGACSLALVGTAFAIDSAAYSSEGWKKYKQFNEYTTQLLDINFPEYSVYEKEYLKLGIDYDDYLLYSSYDHNDPDLFDMEKMQKVKELQPNKTMNIDEFIVFLLGGFNKFFKEDTVKPYTYILLLSILFFVLGSKLSAKKILTVFVPLLFTFVVLFYIYCMHRWLDRTTISVLLSLIFVVLFFIEIRINKIILFACLIFTGLVFYTSFSYWVNSYKWNMDKWISKYQINHEVLDEIYDDQDHLYISRVSWPAWKSYYTPYDLIRKNAIANYSSLGDWLANNPLSVSVLKNYDVVNPYKDIVDNDKVYLIGDASNLDPVILYIRKHYNPGTEAVHIKTIGPYEVYSLRTAS